MKEIETEKEVMKVLNKVSIKDPSYAKAGYTQDIDKQKDTLQELIAKKQQGIDQAKVELESSKKELYHILLYFKKKSNKKPVVEEVKNLDDET